MSTIKSIIKRQIKDETLWNLAVEQDESYVANDIVVHNCRSLLIPITKYEDYTPSEMVGKVPIDQFIEEKKGGGFSKYSIKITDPGVEFVTSPITETVEETVYSKDGKPFQSSLVTYKTKEKLEIKSVHHMRLDDGPKV